MYQRIMIFGLPESGKSTFALKLSKVLKLPLYHLDKYFFISHWIERSEEDFLEIQKGIVEKEQWIVDGNCIHSLETRYKRADIVIYICFPRILCIFRLFQRLLKKDSEILDRAPNCKEKVSWKLIQYLWNFECRIQEKINELRKNYPNVKFFKIKSSQEQEMLLKAWASG